MASNRGEFSSKLGFIMAAAGSAIGLGNIWGFPGQTATNGGAIFVVVYLILAFILAYPALMAELIIGRYSQSNIVGAFKRIKGGKNFIGFGFLGLLAASLILSFYSIIAGWMLSYVFEAIFRSLGLSELASWTINNSHSRTIFFTILFYLLTMYIIWGGVKEGIEKWSSRLMPTLILILIILILYVLTLDGAMDGLKAYLIPKASDFEKLTDSNLLISAMGQAFFSLSLGVGTMLVYGSYISKKENLPSIGVLVTLADVGIAFLAGLLIIPAMYVAQENGVQIYAADDSLIAGPNIAFQVLPSLFSTLGGFGVFVSFIFFLLMTVAALTSSISMLEVPVSYAVDDNIMERKKATLLFGFGIMIFSIIISLNMERLFEFVIDLSTKYLEPIIGAFLSIFVGWVFNRNSLLEELKHGYAGAEHSLFFKIWPIFAKIIVPVLILAVFIHSL
jgi:NSS family neurotransmitter:Na+ symporter